MIAQSDIHLGKCYHWYLSILAVLPRFNFDAACPMNFAEFPVDEQGCMIRFESFGYTVKEVIIWRANNQYFRWAIFLDSDDVDGLWSTSEPEHLFGPVQLHGAPQWGVQDWPLRAPVPRDHSSSENIFTWINVTCNPSVKGSHCKEAWTSHCPSLHSLYSVCGE